MASAHRTYKEECSFIERQDANSFRIKKGFVPNMKVTFTQVEKLGAYGVLGSNISFHSIEIYTQHAVQN